MPPRSIRAMGAQIPVAAALTVARAPRGHKRPLRICLNSLTRRVVTSNCADICGWARQVIGPFKPEKRAAPHMSRRPLKRLESELAALGGCRLFRDHPDYVPGDLEEPPLDLECARI